MVENHSKGDTEVRGERKSQPIEDEIVRMEIHSNNTIKNSTDDGIGIGRKNKGVSETKNDFFTQDDPEL
ncbi:hypothetical protein JTB14_010223 [Gonioctena quinquepunctata]|nr:hypothetical protein JTB14_010223 [Gonioctena quinquepunctata]